MSANLLAEPIALARSPGSLLWRRLRSDRVAMLSLGFIVLLVFVAIAAPLIVAVLGLAGPNEINTSLTDAFGSPLGPSAAHPMGVDDLGRDVMSRVIYATRVSLTVGVVGTALAAMIGCLLGIWAGFYGGWVDTLLSRITDVVLCFPVLLLGVGIGAACSVDGCGGGLIRPGVGTIIAIIAITSWGYVMRIVRGLVLSLREKEFVAASHALGASDRRIMLRDLMPNLLAPLIVYSSLLIPQNILLEAALSYLGIGVRAPNASWGQMLAGATPIFANAWWYMVFPGVALLATVLAFNLFGDALQDALNPKADR